MPMLAMVVVIVVTQVLKALGGLEGSTARWLSFLLSFLVAAVVAVTQRGLPATADPATFLREIGPLWTATFALATLVYHEVLKRQGWLGAGEGPQSRGDSGLVG
jgi:hypothetical protein